MITQLQRIKAARRIVVGLLFVFMAIAPTLAFAATSSDNWQNHTANALGEKGQDGTINKPFTIKNAEELAYLAQLVNDGTEKVRLNGGGKAIINSGFKDAYIMLTDNIDLAGRNWTPIGHLYSFEGHFDGNGYVIKGLKIERDDYTYYGNIGLFGFINNASIYNLGVQLDKEGIKWNGSGDINVGGIAGWINASIISNCYVTGKGKIQIEADGDVYVGGIAGSYSGFIGFTTHCYSTIDIEVTTDGGCAAGGIMGQPGNLSYTYATGSIKITGKGDQYAGGISVFSNETTNSLALNSEITVEKGSNYNRIDPSSSLTNYNYARPAMLLQGSTVTSDNPSSADGADTYSNTFEKELKAAPAQDNGWEKAWAWTPGKLPQLKKRNADGSYSDELLRGQVAYNATDYLQPYWVYHIATAIENQGGNDGLTSNTPILIKDVEELAYFAQQVNDRKIINLTYRKTGFKSIAHNDNNGEGFSAYYFALSADIDLQAGQWTPIGNSDKPFRGHFDGKGHVVKGLKIKMDVEGIEEASTFAGLFGYVVNGALQNIGVELADEGIEVSAENGHVYAGGIAGRIGAVDGTAILRHCYVTGGKDAKIKITKAGQDACAGGITGIGFIHNNGSLTLTHCYATVDVEANANGSSYAGGIAGWSPVASYCYATGNVKANMYANGICSGGPVSNSLALNPNIAGKNNRTYRIADYSSTSNYASSLTKINGSTITSINPDNWNGADTWLDTFKGDLLNVSGGDGWRKEKGWVWPTEPFSTLLPKLMVAVTDASGTITGYKDWPSTSAQPNIDAADYLNGRKTLHIVQPKEGTLTVSYDAPNAPALSDGDLVVVGSTLKLLYTPPTTADYSLDKYFYGTSADQINQEIIDDTYVMPNQDIWISASVNEPSKPEPEPEPVYPPPTPIYYTVTLPQVEGATTDPGAGDHEVESWNTFRFYLTLDPDYSDSQPIVTTSRGETLTPRESDGAYLVKYVRTDVEVRIDSIRPNLPPVANEAIASPAALPRIWTEASTLCIGMPPTAPATTPVYVLTADGRLWRTLSAAPGLNRQTLPRGFYIIRVDDVTRKVIVR